MKILMLNPPFLPKYSRSSRSPAVTKSGTIYYPLWLAHATGYLEQEGHEVKLVDACADGLSEADILKIADKFKPNMIVLDTSTPSIYSDMEIAGKLKELNQNAIVGVVGTHPTALPEETLKLNDKVDFVARREYDLTLEEIASRCDKGESLGGCLGITYRDANKIIHNEDRPFLEDLDRIPFVSAVYKKHLNYKNYFYAHVRNPVISIFVGRGCPHKCIYCVYPQTIFGQKYRVRSAKHFVDEMEYIQNEFPDVQEVLIDDDTFTVYEKKVREMCQMMIDRGINLKWSVEVRVTLSYETMVAMKKAGCRLLVVGFESGVQEILNNIKKGTKIEMVDAFFESAKKADLLVHGCFMAGNKGETKETLEQTLNFAKKYTMDTCQMFPLMVYPGTEAYDWAKENNYLTTTNFREWVAEDGMHNCVVSRPDLTNDYLVEFCNRWRREYYLNPKFLLHKLGQFITQPDERGRIIKAGQTFWKYLLGFR